MERINLAPGGMSGVGTVRMIHSCIARVHDNPSDEEFSDYGDAIDAGEYPNETASAEPVIHKGVLLSAAASSEGDFLIAPALLSDVTIFIGTTTRYAYMVNFSHIDILRLNTRTETVIDVAEIKELGPENGSSPGHDELETTGNKTSAHYTPMAITTIVRNDKNKETITVIGAKSIMHTVNRSKVRQTADKVVQKVNSTAVAVADNKVTPGDKNTTEPLVLGNGLTRLVLDFLAECSKVTTPALMGTMSPVDMPNFISLTSRIRKFPSKTSYTR